MTKRYRIAGGIVLALIAQGCAVAIPIHQDQSAQTLGKGAFEVSGIMQDAPMIGPRNVGINDPENDLGGVQKDVLWGAQFTWGFAESWDAEAEAFMSYFSGVTLGLAAKHQWVGPSFYEAKPGDFYTATRIKYSLATGYSDNASTWTSSDGIFNNNLFVENLSADIFTVSQGAGTLLTSWFGIYGGVELGVVDFSSTIREGGPNGTPYSDSRTAAFGGPYFGLSLHTTGPRFRFEFTAEAEGIVSPNTYTDGYQMTPGVSLGIHFMWRTKHEVASSDE